jgi:hypothetical protein
VIFVEPWGREMDAAERCRPLHPAGSADTEPSHLTGSSLIAVASDSPKWEGVTTAESDVWSFGASLYASQVRD